MKHTLYILVTTALLITAFYETASAQFDTQWISSKPEMLTYRTTGAQEGLYQVSLVRVDSVIEVYINMITPGFTKTVYGTMTPEMLPLESTGKIIINNQIVMDTKCSYGADSLRITTVMLPYNQTAAQTLAFKKPVIDFSQVAMVVRTLRLDTNSQYAFTSVNPRTNTIGSLTFKVIGEGHAADVDCYKVEMNDFEGQSIDWVEKNSPHRVVLVQQPASDVTSELIQSRP
ncbi:MAG: hypothetical protein ACLP05_12085 [Candidatus Kryptoniota bacterium]